MFVGRRPRCAGSPGERQTASTVEHAALHLRHSRPQEAGDCRAQLLQVLVGQTVPDVVLFASEVAQMPGQRQAVPERLVQGNLCGAHARRPAAADAALRDHQRDRCVLR